MSSGSSTPAGGRCAAGAPGAEREAPARPAGGACGPPWRAALKTYRKFSQAPGALDLRGHTATLLVGEAGRRAMPCRVGQQLCRVVPGSVVDGASALLAGGCARAAEQP